MRPTMRPTSTLLRRAAALALLAAPAAGARAQGTISTLPAWNGTDMLGNFGIIGSAAIGQTFVAPTDGQPMTGFSLYLDADRFSARPGDLRFRAHLMSWDGTRAAGPALYQSTVRPGIATQGATRVDFDFAPLTLTGGAEYVLFLSHLGLAGEMGAEPDSNNEYGFVRAVHGYADGRFVYYDAFEQFPDDPSRLTIDPWTQRPDVDLAFEARFGGAATTTPEPATVLLLGAGGAALALVRRRVRVG